jgi:hypothetical protein
MELPIKFPSNEEVIIKDVARFRALSDVERMRAIRGLLKAGELVMRQSPNAASMREYALEQKRLTRQAIKEFIARHVGST